MYRMFLGRVRASEGRAPLFEGGESLSDCGNRMFRADARTGNCGARPSAGQRRWVKGQVCFGKARSALAADRNARCAHGPCASELDTRNRNLDDACAAIICPLPHQRQPGLAT